MLITSVSAVIDAVNVVVLAVVRVVSVCPVLDPRARALSRKLVIAGWRCHHLSFGLEQSRSCISLEFLLSRHALEQGVRIAGITNQVPAVRCVGKVRVHETSVEEFLDVLILVFCRGCVDGGPERLFKLSVDLPLILQAPNKGLRALLAAAAVPPSRIVVGAICQESSTIPKRIEIALVVPPPALSEWHHLTKINDGQAWKLRSICR
jgi:hypothetical protein